MALLFCDSFQHYTEDASITEKWGASGSNSYMAISSTGGRNNGPSLLLAGTAATGMIGSGYVSHTMTSGATTLILGFRLRQIISVGVPHHDTLLFGFRDGASGQCGIGINTKMQLQAYQGDWSTKLGDPSSNTFVFNRLYHIECKVVIDGAAGSLEVRVDGAATGWINLTGIDTQATANNTANNIILCGGPDYALSNDLDRYFADVILMDTSGSYNNDFLGEMSVSARMPNGVGYYSQWTRSTGSNNYGCVDETSGSLGTDYVSTYTDGNIDTYAFTDITGNALDIKAIINTMWGVKNNAATIYLKSVYRQSGTDYFGGGLSPLTTWKPLRQTYETDPSTSLPWGMAAVNSAEFGLQFSTAA